MNSNNTSIMPSLSIIAPAYNEETGIKNFASALCGVICTMDPQLVFEIIIVDDASTDGTWLEIEAFLRSENIPQNVNFRAIRLMANCGQVAALHAGLNISQGKYIITMDSDFQHPVSLIPKLYELRENAPVVVGVQIKRHDTFLKKMLSNKFYKVISRISGLDVTPNGGDFRLMSRQILEILLNLNDSKSVLRFSIARLRIPSYSMPFTPDSRKFGKSKYTIRKIFALATDSVLSITTRPLKLSIALSALFSGLFFVEAVFVFLSYFQKDTVPGWASQALLTTFGFSTLSIILMTQGYYLARYFEQSQNSPNYIIREEIKV